MEIIVVVLAGGYGFWRLHTVMQRMMAKDTKDGSQP